MRSKIEISTSQQGSKLLKKSLVIQSNHYQIIIIFDLITNKKQIVKNACKIITYN